LGSLQVLLTVVGVVAIVGITSTTRHARCCDACCDRACDCDRATSTTASDSDSSRTLSCARCYSSCAAAVVGIGIGVVGCCGLASSCALPASIECHCGAFWLHERYKNLTPLSFVSFGCDLIRCVFVCEGSVCVFVCGCV